MELLLAPDGVTEVSLVEFDALFIPDAARTVRSIAAAEGYTIRANDLGKTKMVSQVVAISCMLLSVRHPALRRPGMILMWGVVFFALLSAVSYFRKFWRKVDEGVKNRRRRELLTLERKRQRAAVRRHRGSRGRGGLGTATISNPPEVN